MDTKPLKISVVTPSYNQGEYLEECIQSVIGQRYANLEYIIIDGGSSDESKNIIEKYSVNLKGWKSEKDFGQYDAINKGFGLSEGKSCDIMAWLNSDDKYLPWTFEIVAEIFTKFPEVEWISTLYPLIWDSAGRPVRILERERFCAEEFFLGKNCKNDFLQQESTFWRRSLWERTGARLETRWQLAGDFELWTRFFLQAHCYGVTTILGGFREHQKQKTSSQMKSYINEAEDILERKVKTFNRKDLVQYQAKKKIAKLFGKSGYFREKGWLPHNAYIRQNPILGWHITTG